MSKEDLELNLIANPVEPEDKKIDFLPIADDSMSFALANFREKDYSEIVITITKKFLANLKQKKTNTVIANLKRKIGKENDNQKGWTELLSVLYNYYPIYHKQLKYIPNRMKLMKLIDECVKLFDKKIKELSEKQVLKIKKYLV